MLHFGFNFWLSVLFCLWRAGEINGRRPDVVNVVVQEGHDAILPCSISTKENIVRELFDWKKDEKEVFLYNAGVIYQNGRQNQDGQFKGRVSHFSEQLKFGNASITITNTTPADNGSYTCLFPKTNPVETYYINLVVERVFKDRSGEILGAPSHPFITIADVTEAGVLLQCVVQYASPKPTLQWKDCGGNLLPAEEPQVSMRRGHYDVILQMTVTKTTSNCFYCEVKQDEIGHVFTKRITVPERLFESCHSVSMFIGGLFAGVLLVAVPLALLKGLNIISRRKGSGPQICNRGMQQHRPEVL